MSERIAHATGAERVELEERLQSLWSGYGELWRAQLLRQGQPLHVIAKWVRPPQNDGSRSHRRKLRSYAVERQFYAQFARRCAELPECKVPDALALEEQSGGWLFVLEDLTANGFPRRGGRHDPVQVSSALCWLARFHARFMGAAPDGLWKVGCYWQLGTRPDELARMGHASLREAAGRIDARLNAARFKSLVHGDAKLENMCFAAAGGSVALVDFQYVGGGVGVKDVAYFLSGVVSPEAQAKLVPTYLDEYFRELRLALASSRAPVDAAAVEREWRELFPVAWVDFYRFLLGWAPGQYDPDPYSEQLTREVLSRI